MVKTNIKLQVTPEQSAKIQQICLDNDICWKDSGRVILESVAYIFIYPTELYNTTSNTYFNQRRLTEVDPELFIATNGTCDTTHTLKELDTDLMESTHTESEFSTKTNKFAEYGFQTPDFQCKLYDKLDDYILGAYFNPNKKKWTMCRWGFDGRNKQGSYNYALTPVLVHKPWYETCKFPILVKVDSFTTPVVVHYYKDNFVYDFRDHRYDVRCWFPLTDAEIGALKQGF